MNDSIKKEFIKCLIDKGFGVTIIKNSFCVALRSEDEYLQIIDYVNKHPKASKNEINYQIHKLSVARQGINI